MFFACPHPPFSSTELAWIDAGEIVFRNGPDAAPLPPLDDYHTQRLWLGGFAIGWLEAGEPIAAPPDDAAGGYDNPRVALSKRLADHPALLAQINARAHLASPE